MSSYFDNAQLLAGKSYVELLEAEEQVYKDVIYITGDREFPHDLREKIMSAMAVEFCWQPGDLTPPLHAVESAAAMSYSRGIVAVHELFHEVARRRIETRFGLLNDHPVDMRTRRDEHDEEAWK